MATGSDNVSVSWRSEPNKAVMSARLSAQTLLSAGCCGLIDDMEDLNNT